MSNQQTASHGIECIDPKACKENVDKMSSLIRQHHTSVKETRSKVGRRKVKVYQNPLRIFSMLHTTSEATTKE